MPKTSYSFAQFIRDYGATKLAAKLGMKGPSICHKWKNGTAQPNLDHALAILKLAKGKLTAADLKKGQK